LLQAMQTMGNEQIGPDDIEKKKKIEEEKQQSQ
jgi:hypothetical protein